VLTEKPAAEGKKGGVDGAPSKQYAEFEAHSAVQVEKDVSASFNNLVLLA
jgi:hypothetical protein